MAGCVFRGLNVGNGRVTVLLRRRVRRLPHIRKTNRPCLSNSAGRVLLGTRSVTGGVKSRFMDIRPVLLTVLGNGSATTQVLGSTNTGRGSLATTVRTLQRNRGIGDRDTSRGCRDLRGCTGGLMRRTHDNGLSPMVNHSRRVHHILRVLSHHAGGGPVLVNRPNANGATVIRKLTRHVIHNSIPRGLGGGRLCSLSVNTLITNTGCGNRFRRHLGDIVGRMAGTGNRVVLFVSRVRALMNTNNNRNTVSTTGVLGPTLTHNRLETVNTAALGRCRGCFRGSGTLRHQFRAIVIGRPSRMSTVDVLHNVGRHCRGRRGIHVRSSTYVTTIGLSRECVSSEFLPSGTVSLVSRTTTGLHVRHSSIPRRLSRVAHRLGRLRVRHRTVGHRGSRPGVRRLSGRVTRLGSGRRSFHTG